MQIYLTAKYLVTGNVRSIEIFDTNANIGKGTFSMNSASHEFVSIMENAAGFGNIRYRNVTNNGLWIGSRLLSDGEEVDVG